MIVFLAPGGRMGNVLFQVAYLESIRRPGERVLSMNLFGIHRTFQGLRRYLNTDFRVWTRFLDKAVRPWLGDFLEATRLVTTHRETDSQLRIRRGLLPLTFVEGYFQWPSAAVVRFKPSASSLEEARRYIDRERRGRIPVFVHVRRTDYHSYRVNGFVDPLLPLEFYKAALAKVREQVPDFHVFFLGDSPEWCQKNFVDVEPKTISSRSPLEDFSVMTQCHGGVVSNSTFAWWGAFFCPKAAPIVGPTHWLAWRYDYWLPRKIRTDWMTYIDVTGSKES